MFLHDLNNAVVVCVCICIYRDLTSAIPALLLIWCRIPLPWLAFESDVFVLDWVKRFFICRRSLSLVFGDRRELYSRRLVLKLSLSLSLPLPFFNPRLQVLSLSHLSIFLHRSRRRVRRTGIGDGDGRRVDVAEHVADRRNNRHERRAGGADDDGPEVGGTLAGCPGAVLEGLRPEEGRRHDGLDWRSIGLELAGDSLCIDRYRGGKDGIEGVTYRVSGVKGC